MVFTPKSLEFWMDHPPPLSKARLSWTLQDLQDFVGLASQKREKPESFTSADLNQSGFIMGKNIIIVLIVNIIPVDIFWLVVDLPLWKMMEWKSVGMMTFPTEWKNNYSCSTATPKKDAEKSKKVQIQPRMSWWLWPVSASLLGGLLTIVPKRCRSQGPPGLQRSGRCLPR